MKKLMNYCLPIALIAILLVSCTQSETEFDDSLLIGKWKSGTVYYRYDSNNAGATWDTSDDVQEADAQKFTWTLDKSTLKQIHIMEIGGTGVPEVYTVTKLTDSVLEYKDATSGKTQSFTKVK